MNHIDQHFMILSIWKCCNIIGRNAKFIHNINKHGCPYTCPIGSNPMTDATTLDGMCLITTYLMEAVTNGKNRKAREKMVHIEFLVGRHSTMLVWAMCMPWLMVSTMLFFYQLS
ncbi:hypothetical protein O6H91_06G045500 [Diphasiastrum complanatum]|uniref:Uncharacterized protein n=1 Tax=Diphasiastrum complanatum TaxID=34168 RepID=A0ACC2DCV8_DIPCM|nr:hypothetical protein O6H91_06G045500 [Diphasiastrum complanatum]